VGAQFARVFAAGPLALQGSAAANIPQFSSSVFLGGDWDWLPYNESESETSRCTEMVDRCTPLVYCCSRAAADLAACTYEGGALPCCTQHGAGVQEMF
jgi:hypothetical protein